MKSPRWRGKPMEVGPLARVLMLYAKGHAQTQELVGMTLKKLDIPVTALFSTLGRTAARTLETKIFADHMRTWYDNLVANIKAGDVGTFNEELSVGLFSGISAVLLLYPIFAVYVKRAHDRNRTGWFVLLLFVPLVNLWPLVEFFFLRGTEGPNKYGPDPIGTS